MSNVQIEASWKAKLAPEFEKPYFKKLAQTLRDFKAAGKVIYPPGSQIFNAFNLCPFDKVKVVILGQDPYHGPGMAMGLSFSVAPGVTIPRSLKNIYKELHTDVDFTIPSHGDLSKWAEQGVFLLNAMLTVEKAAAGSHRKIGWQNFTDTVIQQLSKERERLVFILWGGYAQQKRVLIDEKKHLVLTSVHPSPLSASRGFFGCKHFSQTNVYLTENGKNTINWQV